MSKMKYDEGKFEIPKIYRHKKTKGLYRIVGTFIDRERDEFCVLYRVWNDFADDSLNFGSSANTLYGLSYKAFQEKFERYEIEKLEVVPTSEQAEKDLEKFVKKIGR